MSNSVIEIGILPGVEHSFARLNLLSRCSAELSECLLLWKTETDEAIVRRTRSVATIFQRNLVSPEELVRHGSGFSGDGLVVVIDDHLLSWRSACRLLHMCRARAHAVTDNSDDMSDDGEVCSGDEGSALESWDGVAVPQLSALLKKATCQTAADNSGDTCSSASATICDDQPIEEAMVSCAPSAGYVESLLHSLEIDDFPHIDHVTDVEDDVISAASIGNVSHDEILPGPASGDLYDSDSDSYSRSGSRAQSMDEAASYTSADSDTDIHARRYRYRRSLVPSKEQLKKLDLVDDRNEISFTVPV